MFGSYDENMFCNLLLSDSEIRPEAASSTLDLIFKSKEKNDKIYVNLNIIGTAEKKESIKLYLPY